MINTSHEPDILTESGVPAAVYFGKKILNVNRSR